MTTARLQLQRWQLLIGGQLEHVLAHLSKPLAKAS